MPVSQSTELAKPPATVRFTVIESFGSAVVASGSRNDATCRPVESLSTTRTLLRQLNAPSRSGVSRLRADTRVLVLWAMLSSCPSGRVKNSFDGAVPLARSLVTLRPGDQVMLRPKSSGLGEMVSDGGWCWSCCPTDSAAGCRPVRSSPSRSAW